MVKPHLLGFTKNISLIKKASVCVSRFEDILSSYFLRCIKSSLDVKLVLINRTAKVGLIFYIG
jgi:hypothetical protein